MTAPRACPFCGNAKMEIHHNTHAGITFLLCGDDRGRGGCGAVVSFRPNLTGSKAIQAYNRRAAHADELVEAGNRVLSHRVGDLPNLGYIRDNDESRIAIGQFVAALAKFTHQEKP